MWPLALLLVARAQDAAAPTTAPSEFTGPVIELFKPAEGQDPLRNPYIVDHKMKMPQSVQPICGVTDMYGPGGCWDPMAKPPSGPEIGVTCEQCCFRSQRQIERQGTCWPFAPTPDYVMMNDTGDFCCKGRMRPNFNSLQNKVNALSEGEGVRPPQCPQPGSPEALERYASLPHEEFGCFLPHLGFGCEACCFNPETHPVQWTSSHRDNVGNSACWTTDTLEYILQRPVSSQTPYDWWEECCMALCPPEMSLTVCAIMPYVHYMALGFFALVIIICFVFEKALVKNLLCFRSPPQDEDPFALFGGAVEGAGESVKPEHKKKTEQVGKPSKPATQVAPDPGAGAME